MKEGTPTHRNKIMAGLKKAVTRGRKPGRPPKVTADQIRASIPLGTTKGAASLGLSISTYIRRRRIIEQGETPMTDRSQSTDLDLSGGHGAVANRILGWQIDPRGGAHLNERAVAAVDRMVVALLSISNHWCADPIGVARRALTGE